MVVWCKDENELFFKFKRDLLIDNINDRIVKTTKNNAWQSKEKTICVLRSLPTGEVLKDKCIYSV